MIRENFPVHEVLEANSWKAKADLVDIVIDVKDVQRDLDSVDPVSRRSLCEILGIGAATLSNWFKEGRMPKVARLAYGLLAIADTLSDEVKQLRDEAQDLKIVNTGTTYTICRFKKDEDGIEVGEVLAQGIPEFQHALLMARARKSLALLGETQYVIDDMLERTENVTYEQDLSTLNRRIDRHNLLSTAIDQFRDSYGREGVLKRLGKHLSGNEENEGGNDG